MLLKYDGIIPDSDDNTFNSFINNVENSFNLIFMNENDSNFNKKLINNLKNNNIVFSLKIILFYYYFEYIFNKNYYDYNDNKNYVSYLETMSNIKDIIEILVPSNFNENDLKIIANKSINKYY